MTRLYAALDIGGTKLAAGLVSVEGRVLKILTAPTLAGDGGLVVLKRSLELVENLLESARQEGWPPPVGIGIASAGQIDSSTGLVFSATALIPGWAGMKLKPAFEERFGLPCQVDNDVNGLALGEYRFGHGQGYSQVLYGAAGTGLGGALLYEGKLWRGTHFSAGEFGHSLFLAGGLACECGRRGCLEQYTASRAILRFYQEFTGNTHEPGLSPGPGPKISIREISRWAGEDPQGPAGRAFKAAGRNLGLGLASLVRVLDPEVIILGGGLLAASSLYLEEAQRAFREEAWSAQIGILLLAAKLGPEAGVIGAASLCMTGETNYSL